MSDESNTPREPIVFRGRLTEADAVDLMRCYDLMLVRRSIRWVVIVLATVIAALCLCAVLVSRYLGPVMPLAPQLWAVAITIGWAYLLFGLPRERDSQARRAYRRRAADYLETEVTLSPDRLTIVNEAMRSEFQWRLVKLVVDAPAGIMFCNVPPQPLFWLPARLFNGDRSREQVLSLARSNGIPTQRLT